MAVPIVALKCPVCGAPFQPDSDRCGYCGSILVLKTNHPRIDPRLLNKAVVDEHIAEYRRNVRSDPYDEIAHYGLGVAYFNLGLIEDSVRELTEAAQLMPENPNIQTQLAVVLREAVRQGNASAKDQMERRIELALRLDPNHLEALLLKADVLTEAGRRSDAVEVLEKARGIDSDGASQTLVENLMALAAQQEQSGEWSDLPKTWSKLAEVDQRAAKSLMTRFLGENKKLIPTRSLKNTKAASVGSDVLLIIVTAGLTFFAGFIFLAITISVFGEDSWVPIVALLAALGAVVVMPVWMVKRKHKEAGAPGQLFDREALVQGYSDLATTQDAAFAVVQRKSEEQARLNAAWEKNEQRKAFQEQLREASRKRGR